MTERDRPGPAGFGLWDFHRALLARTLRLPPPRFAVQVARNLPVPMPDGALLFADHYAPRGAGAFPTVLLRTPYGRGREMPFGPGFSLAELPAQRFAERGYHVIVQGVRGRFGSQGDFAPHAQEADDGAATVAWVERQPWFNGRLGTWGPSYLGFAQWAAAARAPGAIHALVPMVTSAENFSVTHPDGAFGLETRLRWLQGLVLLNQLFHSPWRDRLAMAASSRASQRIQQAFRHLPLLEADIATVGRPVPFYRDALTSDKPDDLFWRVRDHSAAVASIAAPAHFVGGWYDYFLPGLLRDYAAMRAAGRQPFLTIGPWHHAHPGTLLAGLREGLRWFDAHLCGAESLRPQPVQIFVMGANEWRGLSGFPPPAAERRLFLHRGRALAPEPPGSAAPDRYHYDPSDPTPALGGALLGFRNAGPQDNRPLEARPDVLCFTTAPLTTPIEIIGTVRLELFVSSSLAHTDFFGRVCDVQPDGRSVNICDGLVRVAPGRPEPQADGTLRLEIVLGAVAHRFQPGHRLRLQVSSGAHPRWSRNLGLGEPAATGVNAMAADQAVYHDSAHPSAVILPTVPA